MKTSIVEISQINHTQKERMFLLMQEYYLDVDRENFDADLADKQKVILMCDQAGQIQGFSTILEETFLTPKGKCIALFSGDTVLNKQFWGNGALASAFGRYLMQVKTRNIRVPVYWFLISKGYKTYLIMANNFPIHYPRPDQDIPLHYQMLMDQFYHSRFGKNYSPKDRLIRFENPKRSPLKGEVAEIGLVELRNPRIRFFQTANPDWKDGVELACVAKVSLWIPLRYSIKRCLKPFRKFFKSS